MINTIQVNNRLFLRSLFIVILICGSLFFTSNNVTKYTNSTVKVLLIDTLSHLNDDFYLNLQKLCNEQNITLDTVSADNFDVEYFKKNEGSYMFVFLRVHSTNQYNRTWIFTGEEYEKNKYLLEQLADEVHRAKPNDYEEYYFVISSDYFVSKKIKLDSVFFVLMGCNGQDTNDMANAFISLGAKCVIGWEGQVALSYSDAVFLSFCETVFLSTDIKTASLFCEEFNSKTISGPRLVMSIKPE